MAKNHELGKLGEQTVAAYLRSQGFSIIKCNYRIRGGEIDIIASKDDVVVFVEVKTRSADALNTYGTALEAVTRRKQALIIKAAKYWAYTNSTNSKYTDCNFRFDVCEVLFRDGNVTKFNYIPSAFTL
jgi:putative endonuclease